MIKKIQSPTFNCHYQQWNFLFCWKKIGINSKIFNHSIKNGNSSKDWKKIQLVPKFFKALLEKINHQFAIIDFGDHVFRSARKFWVARNCFSGTIKSGFKFNDWKKNSPCPNCFRQCLKNLVIGEKRGHVICLWRPFIKLYTWQLKAT